MPSTHLKGHFTLSPRAILEMLSCMSCSQEDTGTRRCLRPEGVAGLGTSLCELDWGRLHPGRCSSVRQAFAVHRVISKARIQHILPHLGTPKGLPHSATVNHSPSSWPLCTGCQDNSPRNWCEQQRAHLQMGSWIWHFVQDSSPMLCADVSWLTTTDSYKNSSSHGGWT